MPPTNAEFNEYAEDYEKLLKDPIRDRFAPGSEFFHRRKLVLIQDYFSSRGLDSKALSWLDIGCGKGELLTLGKDVFGQVAGCDFSEKMLQACSGFETRVQTDPHKLPFDSNSFDFITAVCVYHHIEPRERAVFTQEASRVLKPGGIFGIIEHNPWNPATQVIVSRTPVDANAQLLTSSLSRRTLRQAGFKDAQTRFFLYFPESLYRKMRAVEHALARIPLGGQYAVFARK